MKKTMLIAALAALVVAVVAPAATLKVNSRNFTSEPTMRRRVTLTLAVEGPVTASPWLIAGDSVANFTDTNGVTYFSNVLAGSYRLDIAGSPGRSFPISVADTNAVVDASAVVNSTNANTAYYTAAQVDALIAAGGGGGNSITNLNGHGTNTTLWAVGGNQYVRMEPNQLLIYNGGGEARIKSDSGDLHLSPEESEGNVVIDLGSLLGDISGGTNLPASGLSGLETDPNADRILFWDDSAGKLQYLTPGSGLSISGTTITATGGGGDVYFNPGQSTSWRTLDGSNVVDVVGTLTNNTTGNAASATTATTAFFANNLTAGITVNPVNAYSVTNFNRSHLFNYPATMSYTTNAPDTNDLLLVEYGDPLAPLMPRPPIMWNTWYAFPGIPYTGDLPSHYMVTNMIRFIREHNLPYNTICISDGWQQYYRSNGLIVANWTNWNSTVDFITNTINACHEAGFKVHTYTAFNNYGVTCMGLPASTPGTIDADMAEFARLGFDGVTVDCCETAFYNNVKYQQQMNRQVFRAAWRTGRPMQIHTACVAGGLNGLNLPESMGMVNMLSGFNSNRNDKTPWYPHPEEFVGFGLSNVWSTAYKWLTGPYYDHFAGQHRPGHFNYSTCFKIVQDSAANHRFGRYQISLLSLFQTPFVSGAYTNHTYFTRYLSATNLYWQIHQDPLCKYPSLVWSNDNTMVWKKELGGTNLGSVAFAVMNLRQDGGSATNVPITWDQLGMDTNREVTVQCLWYGTNATAKNGLTLNVPADDILFMKASYRYAPPSVAQGDEVVVRFEDEMRFTSESTTVNTMTTYGPAPWYNNHGLQQLSPTPGSQNMRWCWSPPPNATNAFVRFQMYSAYAGDVLMTNYPTVTYNAPSGRITFDPTSDSRLTNNPFMLTNGQMRWVTNYIAWDATNTSIFLQLITRTSTNSSSRYVLGPMFVKYGYK